MITIYWLLLFLYVGLTLIYLATTTKTPEISPWPIITSPKKDNDSSFLKNVCKRHSDCPSTHVCLGQKCIPKLVQTAHCGDPTGQWISYDFRGVTFAICVCLKPHLMNQKFFGGNCDVDVGCGVHGRYILNRNVCECDPGYKAVGLTCRKIPAIDFANLNPCDPIDEIRVSSITPSDGFHEDYVKEKLIPAAAKCVKRPCTFDALSGRPLKRAKYVDGWGCVCDPRYGMFGVELEGSNKKYLKSPGFDACASIFKEDPTSPVNVKLITYFYLGKREPVSFILFDEPLEEDDLVDLFRNKFLIIGQNLWKYDYAQYFFNTTPNFRARTRKITTFPIFNFETVHEWHYVDDFWIRKCHEIPDLWTDNWNGRIDAYSLLYSYPVCRVDEYDYAAVPTLRGKVVVNPQHLTFKKYDYLFRGNAFVLHYDANVGVNRWTVDLDYGYNAKAYLSMQTNAPYHHVKIEPSRMVGRFM